MESKWEIAGLLVYFFLLRKTAMTAAAYAEIITICYFLLKIPFRKAGILVSWRVMSNSALAMVTRIHLRRSLPVLILFIVLLPGVVFAQMPQTFNFVKSRIGKTLSGYNHHNLFLSKDNRAFFFAYNPKDEKIPFGWYKLEGTHSTARAKRIISSSEFSLLFRVAFSPDGKELLTASKTGEIAVTSLKTNRKTTLGVFTTKIGSAGFATFSFPAYTPDGKYILLHNPWENTLLIIDAAKKDISGGSAVKGFWLDEIGGESPESGESISMYEFSPDGRRVTFGKHQVLDLTTFRPSLSEAKPLARPEGASFTKK